MKFYSFFLVCLCILLATTLQKEVTPKVAIPKAAAAVTDSPKKVAEKVPYVPLVIHEEHSTFALISNILSVYALPSLVYSFTALAVAFFTKHDESQVVELPDDHDESQPMEEIQEFSFEQVSKKLFWTNVYAMLLVGILQWANSLLSGFLQLSSIHATHKNGSVMTSHIIYGVDVSHLFAFILIYLKDRFKLTQILAIFCHFLFLDVLPFPLRILYMLAFALFSGRHYNSGDEKSKLFVAFDTPLQKLFTWTRPVVKYLIGQRLFLIFIFVDLKTFRIKNPSNLATYLLSVLPIVMLLTNMFKYQGMKSLDDWTFVSEHKLPFITIGFSQDGSHETDDLLDIERSKKSDAVSEDKDKTSPSGDKVVTLG